MSIALLIAATVAQGGYDRIRDRDRAPTARERAVIERVLRQRGYYRWDRIELDDGRWEVDDARRRNGRQEYDLKLNRKFRIVSTRRS